MEILKVFLTPAVISISVMVTLFIYKKNEEAQRKTDKLRHTESIFTVLTTCPHLHKADCWMANNIKNCVSIPAKQIKEDEEMLIALLDYYEYICTLYLVDEVDKRLVRKLRERAIVNTAELVKDYIIEVRENYPGKSDKGLIYKSFQAVSIEFGVIWQIKDSKVLQEEFILS